MQNHIFQVWLHVTKEFGLVFAIHQTYLLDYQFCIVESRLDQLNLPLKNIFQLLALSTSPSSLTGGLIGRLGSTPL